MKTHLTACAKEMQAQIFKELTQVLFTSSHASAGGVVLTEIQLAKILHFKTPGDSPVFCKTALNWANENNDRFMALELLKLERGIHETEVEGLECLRTNLSSDSLLPWIIESYSKFYDQPGLSRWCEAFWTVLTELVIFSYLPFIIDLYSDVNLALNYGRFAYVNETFNISDLLTCADSQLNSSCYDRTGSDHYVSYVNMSYDAFDDDEEQLSSDKNRHMFEVACWMTAASIIFSSLFYFCCIAFDTSPSCLAAVPNRIVQWGRNRCWNESLLKAFGWVLQKMLIGFCKLLWPLVHIGRRMRYHASVKRSEHKEQRAKSDETWNNIKTVEYGIESSLQLFLQLWLLRPFLPGITVWDSTELVTRCVSGIANFLTFDIYPACYIEKALGKILLTIISVSLGVAQMKCNKPGLGLCEKPFKTVPILLSVLAQTIARIFAIRSLILLTSPLGYNKYAIFFIPHFLLVFLIKTLFETKSFKSKLTSWGLQQKDCIAQKSIKTHFLNFLKFFASGISSTIVMIHLHGEKPNCRKSHFSFVSHSLFFVLVLVENVILVCLPYLVPDHYPQLDCFTADSRANAVWIVLVLWLAGVFFHALHYKWAHPWAKLNGPQVWDAGVWAFTTKFCWKRDVQRVSVKSVKYSKIRVECENIG